jgi:hypothetical protein
MAKRSTTIASIDPLAGRIEHPMHRVRWWRFGEHSEYRIRRGHHRDCRSAAEAEAIKTELRQQHGGPDRCLINIECLSRPCPECQKQLPGADRFPWRAGRIIT